MSALDDARRRLEARLEELRPAVEEAEELERLLELIRGVAPSGPLESGGRQRIPYAERAEAILTYVRQQPGIRVGSLAKLLGLSSPRVVQIVNRLEAEELVRRQPEGGIVLGEQLAP